MYRVKTNTKFGEGELVAFETCGTKNSTIIREVADLPDHEVKDLIRCLQEGHTGVWPIVKMDELPDATSRAMFPDKRLSFFRHDIVEIEWEG